jgi:hypothetical protein
MHSIGRNRGLQPLRPEPPELAPTPNTRPGARDTHTQ